MPKKPIQSGDSIAGLSPGQAAFVAHYLAVGKPTYLNGTRAAIAAGYAAESARGQAWRLRTNANVARQINQHLADAGVSVEKLLAELASQVFSADPADFEELLDGRETMAQARKRGVVTRWIKKIKARIVKGPGEDDPTTIVEREVELIDLQKSLSDLLRALGRLPDTDDRHDKNQVAEDPIEARRRAAFFAEFEQLLAEPMVPGGQPIARAKRAKPEPKPQPKHSTTKATKKKRKAK
jgi:phage terminase small subunit